MKRVWIALWAICGMATATAKESRDCANFMAHWYQEYQAKDLAAAATSFVGVARECREAFDGPVGKYTPYFVQDLQGKEWRAARLAVLDALYQAHFKYQNGAEPGGWWMELALQALERDDLAAARQIAQRIDSPGSLLGMRVDRRYDRLTQAMPERFDVAAANNAIVEKYRRLVADSPRSLSTRVDLARVLRSAGRWQEGLDDIDAALAGGEAAFDDWKEFQPWAHTMRGFTLLDLQRYAEGLEALRRADSVNTGEDDVSFVLNLAYAQANMSNPEEALVTLQRAGNASDYGDVVRALVALNASVQKGDTQGIDAALKVLMEKSSADPTGLVDAYLRAGRLKDAKKRMLEILADPESRTAALIAAQDYRNSPPMPGQVVLAEGWKTLVAMSAVKKAILKVGRREHFDFPSQ